MAFVLPTFNLTCNIWRSQPPTPVLPADVVALCNFSLGKRISTGADYIPWFNLPAGGGVGISCLIRIMLLPALTDIRGLYTAGLPDWVEVPAGSGRFYRCMDVDDMAKGFANEHRLAWVIPQHDLPLPVPLP
jgi:hypothetical protein